VRPLGLEMPPGADVRLVNAYLIGFVLLELAVVAYVCVITARAI
jgi:hypothetical protein